MLAVVEHAVDVDFVFQQHSASAHGARNNSADAVLFKTPKFISPKLWPQHRCKNVQIEI